MTVKTKNILNEILILLILTVAGLIVTGFTMLIFYISSLLNLSFVPLLRFYVNTVNMEFIRWWFCSLVILIALRFWVVGLIFAVYSLISFIFVNLPKYLIMSRLSYIELYLSNLIPFIFALSLVLVIILMKTTKNEYLSYFTAVAVLVIFGSFNVFCLSGLYNALFFNLFSILSVGLFFAEKELRKRFKITA